MHRKRLVTGLLALTLGALPACQKSSHKEAVAPVATVAPPKSDLPTLELGDMDQLGQRLDKLSSEGGTASVTKWAEKELVPGRSVTYGNQTVVLADRSLWSADGGGRPTGQALLRPTTDEQVGKLLVVLARPLAKEPFVLRIRSSR